MNNQHEEKRKFARVNFACKIFTSSPIRLLLSHSENIGEEGLRALLEEKLSNQTVVGLEIFVDKEKPIKCKGKVVWVSEEVNPIERKPVLFDTGIQFTQINDCDRQYLKKLVEVVLKK